MKTVYYWRYKLPLLFGLLFGQDHNGMVWTLQNNRGAARAAVKKWLGKKYPKRSQQLDAFPRAGQLQLIGASLHEDDWPIHTTGH